VFENDTERTDVGGITQIGELGQGGQKLAGEKGIAAGLV